MRAVSGVDELCGDTQPIAGPLHATFEYMADIKGFANFLNGYVSAAIVKRRRASNHAEVGNARERMDQLF